MVLFDKQPLLGRFKPFNRTKFVINKQYTIMKKSAFLPGKRMAVLFSVILACFVSFGTLKAQTVVTSLTIGAQTGNVTYGTAGTVTFSVSFNKTGSGPGLTRLSVNWITPAGVTTSFPVDINPETEPSPVTLVINTSSATPAGTTGFTISSTSNAFASAQAFFVVGVKPLTVTGAAANNKVYDRNNFAIITGTLNGIIGADVVTLVGTGFFATSSVGNNIAVTSSSTLGGANAGNYTLVHPTGLSANITPKPLTMLGLTGVSKVYDGTTTATVSGTAVLYGVVSGDLPFISLSGTPVYNFADALVGISKPITVSGYTLAGTAAGNYTLSQPSSLTANITTKAITITGLTGVNKVYDGTTAASVTGTAGLSGIITADAGAVTLAGTPVYTFASAAAGTGKAITVAGYTLTGSASTNYSLTQPAGLTANITPKALTITGAAASNKVYDATNSAVITGVLDGKVGSDVVTLNGTGNFASTNAGTAIPVVSTCTLSGAAAANYTITHPVGLTANITPKALTVASAVAANKPYDGTNAATITGTLSGIAGLDVVTLNGAGTFASVNAGTGIAVTSTSSLGGAASANYTLTQPTGLTANIIARPISVTGLTGVDKVYDRTTTATTTGTVALAGVLTADVPNVTLAGSPVVNFATATVGAAKTIVITGYNLTGSASGNYSLVQPTGLTAAITPLALTLSSPAASNKMYNGNNATTITGTLTGVISPDVVSLNGTGTFASINAGTGIAVTSTSTLSGADAANYTLTQPAGLTANITLKPLTITATGPAKVYGTSLPAGTSTTNFIATATAGTELVTSVTLRPNAEGLLASTSAGTAYTVTPSLAMGTGGFLASNYDITYLPYSGIVSPRAVTITANPGQKKLIGTTDPVLTYTFAPVLFGSDIMTGALSRVAGETVEGSPYAITLGTLSAGPNYGVTFEPNTFAITSASDASISAFNFTLLPNYPEVINQTDGTITVPVRNTASLPSLVATFTASPGAVVKVGTVIQTSGITSNNFTGVVNYVVTSANGLVTKSYAVTVNKNPVLTEKQLLTFSFPELPDAVGVINQTDFTVTVHVPQTYSITNLVAKFTLSPLATAEVGAVVQTSEVTANNFTPALTTGFTYTIRAENASTRIYYVYLVRDPLRTDKQLLTYSLQGISGAIDESAHTVEVTVPHSYNLTNLVATFTNSLVSMVRIGSDPPVWQTSGVSANNFTNPVIYTVVAENGTTQNYTVYVTQLPASSAKQITAFQFANLAVPAVGTIDQIAGTIMVTVPSSAGLTNLVATFTKSPLSVVTINGQTQISGVTVNNYSTDLIYKVIAEDNSEKDYTVHVTLLPASKENKLLTFSVAIPGGTVNGIITEAAKTVLVEVPYGTNLTDLVASFTVSPYASVKIGEVPQVSGVTHNDFTLVKAYKVIAEDTSVEIYNVTVRVLPVFLTFSFDEAATQPAGVIDSNANTIVVHIPFTVSKTTLKAFFTVSGSSEVFVGATQQVSGVTVNDFTTPKTYTLRALNGSVRNYQVSVITDPAKTEKKILSFAFNSLVPPVIGTVNDTTKTVTVYVPFGTNVTSLPATFTLSEMASARIGAVAQTSGVTLNNYSSPVVYTIVAENATTQNYTVQVVVGPNPEKKIISYQLMGFASPVMGVINEELKTVALHVPYNTNVTSLIASFVLSPGATAKVSNVLQVSGVTPNNFTLPVTYVIYAQNGSFINYQVFVIVDPNNQKQLLTFSFDDISPKPVGAIDETNRIVRIGIPFTVSRSSLRAFFTVSANAMVFVNGVLQESGISINNFSADTVLYRIVAQDASIQNYKIVVRNNPIERGKEIISYNFNSTTPPSIGSIDANTRMITVHVPYNTTVNSLIATFAASPRAKLTIGAVEQISGVTVNNFTNPVTILVTAEDATTQSYLVSVVVDPSFEKQIIDFKFLSLVPPVVGIVNELTKRVDLTVPYGTDVTNLVATFNTSAKSWARIGTIFQYSGVTANNFTSPLIYQIVAENGTTQDYTVAVTILPSSEKKFLTFQVDNVFIPANGVINEINHTIQVNIPFSTSRTSLVVSYTTSVNATVFLDGVQQTSPGTPVNFSYPRVYTVRAQDGSMQTYTVTVSNNLPEAGNTILTFRFANLNPEVECVIDQTNRTITGSVPYGTNLTNLVASFTKSYLSVVTIGAVVQQSGVTVNNFTGSLIYRCTAEDGTPRNYTVTISLQAPSTAKEITYFAFEDLSPVCVGTINQAAKTITVNIPFGSNIGFLRATFEHSARSTVSIVGRGSQISGISYNDYATPVVYRVQAQDGSTADYTVTVIVSSDTTPPVVSNPSQTVSNASGQFVIVQSNEATGKVYIIKSDAPQTSLADLEASVTAGLGRSAPVTQNDTEIRISTYTMEQGVYYSYAVDGVGNKSLRGVNSLYINDVLAPNVFVHGLTISNSLRNQVNVQSSESRGYVYLVIEGVPRSTRQELDAAVGALKGQKALVTAANVDVPVSVYQLMPGIYRAFAIDAQNNLSAESSEAVVITEASHLKSILAYSFNSLTPPATGQIVGTDISVKVPVGTVVTSLVANFTLSPMAKAYVGLVEQNNGVSPNNFTNPVVYTVEAEDGSTLEYTVTVSFYTGIDLKEWFSEIKTYPNPFSDRLTIEMTQPAERIHIINTLGQTVYDINKPGNDVVVIETGSWMKGIYFVRYYLQNKCAGVQKVIRE